MAAAQASTGMFWSWLLVPEQGVRAKVWSSELEQSSEVFDGFKVPVGGSPCERKKACSLHARK